METNEEMNEEISEEEAITNNIRDIIRVVFKSTGEVIMRIGSITPHSFIVVTEGNDFRVTWAPGFVIVHVPSKKPVLVEAFTQAIGFRPFSRYIENGLLVFEWDWADSKERFTELESIQKIGRIRALQKL